MSGQQWTKRRGLFAGRFQPFHLGHAYVVEEALTRVDELIVGVSAPEESFTPNDPFTCGERIEMIWNSLSAANRERCIVLPVPSRSDNALWVPQTIAWLPPFDVSFTGNPLQLALLKFHGVEACQIPVLSRDRLKGRVVRWLLARGDSSWMDLVPPPARDVLERLQAAERLAAAVSANDS